MADLDGRDADRSEDSELPYDDSWLEDGESDFDWDLDEPRPKPFVVWLAEGVERLLARVPGTAAFWSRLEEEASKSAEWSLEDFQELTSLAAGQKHALLPLVRTIEEKSGTLRSANREVSDGVIQPAAMILVALAGLSAPLLANAWWAGAEYPFLTWVLLCGATLIAGSLLGLGVLVLGMGIISIVPQAFRGRLMVMTAILILPVGCLLGPAILGFWLARALAALEIGRPDAWGLLWAALPLAAMGTAAAFTCFGVATIAWESAFVGWAMRRHGRHLIPHALLNFLQELEAWPEGWESASYRMNLADALEGVAELISHRLARHLVSGDRIADAWIRRMTAEMANHLRWLKIGLILPEPGWHQRLLEEIAQSLVHTAKGHWGALKRRPLEVPLWRLELSTGLWRFVGYLRFLVWAVALPVGFWALQRTSFALSGLAADLATAGVLLYAAIQLLVVVGLAFTVRAHSVLDLGTGSQWLPDRGVKLDWEPGKAAAEGEGTVFVTLVGNAEQRAKAELLIDSLRTFGGAMRECPVWLFEADPEGAPCAELAGEGVEIHPLDVPVSVRRNWFAGKVCACARAEEMAGPEVSSLVWVAPDCLIIQPPLLLDLGRNRGAAVRPVHHRNVGLAADEPLDPFWQGVYQAVGVPDIHVTVESFVDGERLRAYYNSHILSVRPASGIFRRWFQVFEKLVGDQAFQEAACQDVGHQVFLHQAVLSALLGKRQFPGRVRRLPPEYSYPYNLHGEVPAERRAKALNDLVCIAYEDRPLHPEQVDDIEIREPLRSWLLVRTEHSTAEG